MHRICKKTLLTFLVVIFLIPTSARGALPGIGTWTKFSDDQRFVLVMISPLSIEEELSDWGVNAENVQTLRETYPQSGLYYNDGTTTPIWTVPYHDSKQEIFISPEGKYLVCTDESWYTWSGRFGHVVDFYANGTELATYSDSDLFSELYLSGPLSRELNCQGVAFDADQLTFTTYSNQGHRFVFDVTTGRLIPQAFYVPWGIIAAVFVLGIAAIAVWRIWRAGNGRLIQ